MKDSPNYIYINIILLIKSPSNFPIYLRDSPIFYTYKSRGGFLKSSLKPAPFLKVVMSLPWDLPSQPWVHSEC